MTPQQLIGVALRLIALWWVVTSVQFFASVSTSIAGLDTSAVEWGSLVAGIVYVAGALVLWMFPMAIAGLILPRTRYTNFLQVPGFELARVGCALIGLWLFVRTLPYLIWSFLRALLATTNTSAFESMPVEMKLELGMYAFNLAVGAVLVANAGRFAGLIARQPSVAPEARDLQESDPSSS